MQHKVLQQRVKWRRLFTTSTYAGIRFFKSATSCKAISAPENFVVHLACFCKLHLPPDHPFPPSAILFVVVVIVNHYVLLQQIHYRRWYPGRKYPLSAGGSNYIFKFPLRQKRVCAGWILALPLPFIKRHGNIDNGRDAFRTSTIYVHIEWFIVLHQDAFQEYQV